MGDSVVTFGGKKLMMVSSWSKIAELVLRELGESLSAKFGLDAPVR